MMNLYSTLRNICTIWTLLALVAGIIIGLAGGAALVRGDLIGIAYVLIALAIVLFAQTLSEVISLLIDMAIYLRRISELTGPQIDPEPKLPPQIGIRKLPKD